MAKNDDSFEEGFDADAPILSEAEITKIKAEARAAIIVSKKADAKKKLLEQETQRLRNEEGLTTGNAHSDEIVNITIDLPIFAAHILLNSRPYWNGHTYPVPRHIADTLRDQMYRSWEHQSTIEGKSRAEFYAQKHIADLYKPSTKGAVLSSKAV